MQVLTLEFRRASIEARPLLLLHQCTSAHCPRRPAGGTARAQQGARSHLGRVQPLMLRSPGLPEAPAAIIGLLHLLQIAPLSRAALSNRSQREANRSSLAPTIRFLARLQLLLCEQCLHAEIRVTHDFVEMASVSGLKLNCPIGCHRFSLPPDTWSQEVHDVSSRLCCESLIPKNPGHAVGTCVSCRFPLNANNEPLQ